MKCQKCGSTMKQESNLRFNEFTIPGWHCSCGETYYDPDEAQRILALNKLRKKSLKAKIGRIRSNLILRIPKAVEHALGLSKGNTVNLTIKENKLMIELAP